MSLKKALAENDKLKSENEQLKKRNSSFGDQKFFKSLSFVKNIVDTRKQQHYSQESGSNTVDNLKVTGNFNCENKIHDDNMTKIDNFQSNVLIDTELLSSNIDQKGFLIIKECLRQLEYNSNLLEHKELISNLLKRTNLDNVESILNNIFNQNVEVNQLQIDNFKTNCAKLIKNYSNKMYNLENIIVSICTHLEQCFQNNLESAKNIEQLQLDLKCAEKRYDSILNEKNILEDQLIQKDVKNDQDHLEMLTNELHHYKINCDHYEKQIELLNARINECEEDRKISQKHAFKIIKELKKQYNQERKRADKLQNLLNNELVYDEAGETTIAEPSISDKGSSTGSWSYMNEPVNSNSGIIHDSEFCDLEICDIPATISAEMSRSGLQSEKISASTSNQSSFYGRNSRSDSFASTNTEQDSTKLLEKIFELQKEKCALEEQIILLEKNLAVACKCNKQIQANCKTTSTINGSILKLVNYLKDKGNSLALDGGQLASNVELKSQQKMKNLVEEILTKNIQLETNLESITDQLFQCKEKLRSMENSTVNNGQ